MNRPDNQIVLPLDILPQPNDETCGPTCLHAVYRFWGETIELDDVIDSTRSLAAAGAGRGTLAVMLGIDALNRGFKASLSTFNLQMFDPTWFDEQGAADRRALADKISAQLEAKGDRDARFATASAAYLEFLQAGGDVHFLELTSRLLSGLIRAGRPILTGLSATYLYRCAREFGPNDDEDDIRGEPAGHFVVLHGYDPSTRMVTIADPLADNPGFDGQRYAVAMSRLTSAILLGVLTYDANLLVIEPGDKA